MAVKPIIKPIKPFDVADGYRIQAQYAGAMPYYNRVIVQDANTLVTVYDRTIASSEYAHYIDPSYTGSAVAEGDTGYSLINGRRYSVSIQFIGRNKSSELGLVSDKVSFLTRTSPSFYFEGLEEGETIDTASIGLNLVYKQKESEALLNFRFELYDNNKQLLQVTDIFYDTTNTSYVFKGLENVTEYYVRAVGTTANGIPLDTGYVEFFVQYENPAVYARMYVENNPLTSEMNYRTNFVIIEADEGEDFEYEDGTWIHLEDGLTVTYSRGFEIEGDATWFIRCRDVDYEQVIMRCWNDNYEFYLEGIRDTDQRLRFRLVVPNGAGQNYILYSESIFIDWQDICNIWIRRINNIYELKLFVEYVPYVVGNYYLTEYDPEPQRTFLVNQDKWITMEQVPPKEIPEAEVVIKTQADEPEDAEEWNIWIGD